jgi:ubiquinone/menaquinone biosynthesis C-methylase UbiE
VTSEWWLDEIAHAGHEHLDTNFVSGYDRKQDMDFGPEVDLMIRHGLKSSSTLVDLGAGFGKLSLAVAPHCGRVLAVDVSPAMVAHVRQQVAERGIGNIDVIESGLLSYEHPGLPPSFVYCRNVLHQLPDLWKVIALDRIARLLPQGGVLRLVDLVVDAEPDRVGEVVEAWLAGAVDDPSVGYTRSDFVEHLQTEYSTCRWLLEAMLARAGFQIVECEYRRSVYGAYVCLKK